MTYFVPLVGRNVRSILEEAEKRLAGCSPGTTSEEISGGFNYADFLRHGNRDPLVQGYPVFPSKALSRLLN